MVTTELADKDGHDSSKRVSAIIPDITGPDDFTKFDEIRASQLTSDRRSDISFIQFRLTLYFALDAHPDIVKLWEVALSVSG